MLSAKNYQNRPWFHEVIEKNRLAVAGVLLRHGVMRKITDKNKSSRSIKTRTERRNCTKLAIV